MTTVKKRSIVVGGHATSVSLEGPFWDALKELAAARQLSLNALIANIDARRQGNLSSALRLFVLDSLKERLNKNEDVGCR